MDKNTIQKLKDAIAKSNSIGIAVGMNPSLDEMGAALSLYLLLRNANKRVSIASPTNPIVEISSLVGIDRVAKNFGGDAGDLVVSFPYKEGEIEKVSYTLENNFLNIIVKSSEQGLSFDEKDVKYSRSSGSIDLLMVVGTASLDQIGDVIDSQKLANISIINIDNDPANQGFGDIVLVSPQASSVSEHVADIVLTLGFALDPDSSQNMLSGIMSATSNFQDPKTSSLAFEVSSFLMNMVLNEQECNLHKDIIQLISNLHQLIMLVKQYLLQGQHNSNLNLNLKLEGIHKDKLSHYLNQ